MYYYWGFGLNIASEIEFPELLPALFPQADVVIKKGEIAVEMMDAAARINDVEYLVSETEYYLDIKNVCKYHVTEGRSINIAPYGDADDRSIRIYILATVMAVVLLQRGSLPLHASGIVQDDKLILFTGDSGAGKSTTLAYLVSKGYRIFTDDICVLRLNPENESTIDGIASYPMLKLWDDAILKLDHNAFSDKTFRIRKDMDKYGYFFYDSFIKTPLPIEKIFIIKTGEGINDFKSRKLSGMEAFKELEKQAYRKYLINNLHLRAMHFKTMSVLSNSCIVTEIYRPQAGTVPEFAAALEALF